MRKLAIGVLACLGLGAVVASGTTHPFMWNKTASIPKGLYVQNLETIEVGAIVSFPAPPVAREYAILRGWRGDAQQFMKTLGAGPNDRVCVFETNSGDWLAINDKAILAVKDKDRFGNPLPHWLDRDECKTLGPDEWLPLGTHPDSFDGRYYGPVSAGQVTGPYYPIKTFEGE